MHVGWLGLGPAVSITQHYAQEMHIRSTCTQGKKGDRVEVLLEHHLLLRFTELVIFTRQQGDVIFECLELTAHPQDLLSPASLMRRAPCRMETVREGADSRQVRATDLIGTMAWSCFSIRLHASTDCANSLSKFTFAWCIDWKRVLQSSPSSTAVCNFFSRVSTVALKRRNSSLGPTSPGCSIPAHAHKTQKHMLLRRQMHPSPGIPLCLTQRT
jgi:hypothetical protein